NILEDLPDRWGMELSSALSEVSSMCQQSLGLRDKIDSIIAGSDGHNIYWASLKGQNNTLSLHVAPLRAGPELEKLLFSQKECVVLTSATLTTEGNFDFTKDALGLIEAKELIIDAPFDYMSSTMIYLPQDIPEPDKPGYQQMVEHSLVDLCRMTQGRTMVLFTSHAALRATYNAIRSPLEEEGILVLGQGLDGSPKRLVDTFKTNKSVLLGTTAFWEGVDIAGKALSVLVITRLPFSVPTDPIFSARSELFDNPFNQYTVPQTAIRFKQGFGRLIRSSDDRGVMIVLDSRLQTRPYGRVLLDSLPGCTIRSEKLRQMPGDVVGWLGD
ncbi:ATP-dependent DNA helicase, partial [Chloroflexota bacterium]